MKLLTLICIARPEFRIPNRVVSADSRPLSQCRRCDKDIGAVKLVVRLVARDKVPLNRFKLTICLSVPLISRRGVEYNAPDRPVGVAYA